nr:reverse transcriptase domain-containing protein [Tanacetum cinerariifolium]
MADSQSPEEEVRGTNSKDKGTVPRKGSIVSFLLDPHHPPSTFINKRKNMLKARREKPNERLVKVKPHSSPVPKHTLAAVVRPRKDMNEQTVPTDKRMTLDERKNEKIKMLKALIEGFQVRRIYVDGRISLEVMYEHCFRSLGVEKKARLVDLRTPEDRHEKLKSSSLHHSLNDKEKDELPKAPNENKPPKKVVIHDDHPDQTVTITGNPTTECRTGLIEILRKHVDTFAWTPTDMTRIPRLIAEHELKTYPHIEPRVQRKRSIALDRRKVVKEEVAEWLKAEIVRRV